MGGTNLRAGVLLRPNILQTNIEPSWWVVAMVLPQSVSMYDFWLGLGAKLYAVNQIIDAFYDNIGPLPVSH